MHAAQARSYVRTIRPDLAERLAPAADYRPLERTWIEFATAAYELLRLGRERSDAGLRRR